MTKWINTRKVYQIIMILLSISMLAFNVSATESVDEELFRKINGELVQVSEEDWNSEITDSFADNPKYEYDKQGNIIGLTEEDEINFEMSEYSKDANSGIALLSTDDGTITASSTNSQLVISKNSNINPNETIYLVSNVKGYRVKSYTVKYYKGDSLIKTLSYTGNSFSVPKTVDISSTKYTTSQQITLLANEPYRIEAGGGNNVSTWNAKYNDLYGSKECTSTSRSCIWELYSSSGYGYRVSVDVDYPNNQVLDLAIGNGSGDYQLSSWVYEGEMTATFKSTQARNQTLLVGAGGANNSLSKSGKGTIKSSGLYSGGTSSGYAYSSTYDVDDGVSCYGGNQTSNATRYKGSGTVTVDNTIVGWYNGGEVSGYAHLGQGYISSMPSTSGASSYIKGTTYKTYADGSGEPIANSYAPIFKYGYGTSSSSTPYVTVTKLSYYDSVVIEPVFEEYVESGTTTIAASSNMTHGTIIPFTTLANKKETVAFAIAPEYGYKYKTGTLKVVDASGNTLLTLADDATSFTVPYIDNYYEYFSNGNLKNLDTCYATSSGDLKIKSSYSVSSSMLTGTFVKGLAFKSSTSFLYFTDLVDYSLYDTLYISTGNYGGTQYSSSTGPLYYISTNPTESSIGTSVASGTLKTTTEHTIDVSSINQNATLVLAVNERTDSYTQKTNTMQYYQIYLTGSTAYSNVYLTAEFEPDYANYTVNHYTEQLDGTYILYQSEIKSGIVNSSVTIDDVKIAIKGETANIITK